MEASVHRIGKQFTFDAAHHLPGLPAGHKCARVHGHRYTAEFILTADRLTPPGFVTDFGDLAPAGHYIDTVLDHHDLNTVLGFEPTCEAIAQHLACWFDDHIAADIPGRLEAVRVWETPASWAEYTIPGKR
jgi:6-pyruvoyltetrahydropterin/6-carboxytetrahydropterin synthase